MTILAVILGVLLVCSLVFIAMLMREKSALSRQLLDAAAHRSDLERKLTEAATESVRLTERAQALADRREADIAAVQAQYRARWEEAERAQRELREDFEKRLAQAQSAFREVMQSTAAEALKASSEHLLKLADDKFKSQGAQAQADLEARRKAVEGLVAPITETLRKTDEKLSLIERQRAESFGQLGENMRTVAAAGEALRKETSNLVQALRKPQVRGRYGEVQLKRVAELAGLRDYCDFSEQESSRDDEGTLRRPDMVVRLPNDRVIAVDAKTNIEAYLDAVDAPSPELAEQHIDRFARHVADQAKALGDKDYASHIDGALDFVVMFIPGDQFIDAALSRRPDLLELAATKHVIIASPSTLIGLLRAVHVGWREKRLTDSAQELFALGRELHERAAKALELIGDVGSSIEKAGKAYNALVGSIDVRLMPTLRKFEDAGARSEKPLKDPDVIEVTPRPLTSLPPA